MFFFCFWGFAFFMYFNNLRILVIMILVKTIQFWSSEYCPCSSAT